MASSGPALDHQIVECRDDRAVEGAEPDAGAEEWPELHFVDDRVVHRELQPLANAGDLQAVLSPVGFRTLACTTVTSLSGEPLPFSRTPIWTFPSPLIVKKKKLLRSARPQISPNAFSVPPRRRLAVTLI